MTVYYIQDRAWSGTAGRAAVCPRLYRALARFRGHGDGTARRRIDVGRTIVSSALFRQVFRFSGFSCTLREHLVFLLPKISVVLMYDIIYKQLYDCEINLFGEKLGK